MGSPVQSYIDSPVPDRSVFELPDIAIDALKRLPVNWRLVFGLLIAAALGAGAIAAAAGSKPAEPPQFYPLRPKTRELPSGVQDQIQGILALYFGTPEEPRLAEFSDTAPRFATASLREGRTLFRARCVHCHGFTGDGDGPTARFLNPVPRDLRSGLFKFISNEGAWRKPSRADIVRTLHVGVPGTLMPSFGPPDHVNLEALADYVLYLAMLGDMEKALVDTYQDRASEDPIFTPEVMTSDGRTLIDVATDVFSRWELAAPSLVPPPPSEERRLDSEASRASGERIFFSQVRCDSCHGPTGRGDGAGIAGLRDDWGNPIRPADLTAGFYRGGRRPIDLYRRIALGVNGTPMPGFGSQLQPQDIWDLVSFVRSLGVVPALPSEPHPTGASANASHEQGEDDR